jgi:hypothetical protein
MTNVKNLRAVADESNARASQEAAERQNLHLARLAQEDDAAEVRSLNRLPAIVQTLEPALVAASRMGAYELRVMELTSWEFTAPATEMGYGHDPLGREPVTRACFRGAALAIYDMLVADPRLRSVIVQTDYDSPSGYSWNYLTATW